MYIFSFLSRNFEQVKQVCLELEDQTKAYELVIEKLETTLEKLKKSNAELKTKADDATAEMIKAKRDVNELKSTQAFKETKLKDLEEKNKEIEKFYETEGATWKTR
jgi:chromosome segregation ATPase